MMAFFSMVSVSVASSHDIAGAWVQRSGDRPDYREDGYVLYVGFVLYDDGIAESINSHTLLYKNWEMDGDKLILTAESIGNRTSSMYQEIYTIQRLDSSTLVLRNEFGYDFTYHRISSEP